MNLQLFTSNINTSTSSGMTAEMKTYYDDYLIDCAEPKLVHDLFGQKRPIPVGEGNQIAFRKVSPLGTAQTPLTEGVTPTGQSLTISAVTAALKQYGGYVELSDMVVMTAIDNNLVVAAKQLGAQAGKTLDAITREVLVAGTTVQYAEGQVTSRASLVGGASTGNHYMTVDAIRRAVRTLKNNNAEPIDGNYVAIIHPDVAYDLMNDPKWVNVKSYADPEGIYAGEIGRLENVRFVETSEAKIFTEAGASDRDVYATLILGDNAYGTTEVAGGGLELIVKQLGSAGSSDPLDQRATVAWKATKAVVRLEEKYMIRIETTSSF